MDEMNFDYINYITGIPNNMLDNFNNKTKDNNDITSPLVGLVRGNLFNNLYDQYKNYKPIIMEPNSPREDLLNKWRQYNFAIVDLNLYLDTNPNDKNAIKLLNNYITMAKELTEQYENMYGQLSVNSNNGANTFTWIKKPWPWEGGK